MLQRNRRPSPALVLSLLALVWAAGGDAFAAGQSVVAHASALITGKQIKNGTITGSDIKAGTIKARNINAATLKALVGPIGPAGPQGSIGPAGPAGLSNGAAGGDLTGNFPNPTIKGDAVTGTKVLDGSLRIEDFAIAATDQALLDDPPPIPNGTCLNFPIQDADIQAGDVAIGFAPTNLQAAIVIRPQVTPDPVPAPGGVPQSGFGLCNVTAGVGSVDPPEGNYRGYVIHPGTLGQAALRNAHPTVRAGFR